VDRWDIIIFLWVLIYKLIKEILILYYLINNMNIARRMGIGDWPIPNPQKLLKTKSLIKSE